MHFFMHFLWENVDNDTRFADPLNFSIWHFDLVLEIKKKNELRCLAISLCCKSLTISHKCSNLFTDSTELLPSLWVGTYTCPGELPQGIQMNVTQRNTDDIFTSTVLSFAGISVSTTGTYGFRQLLTQGTSNQNNITVVKLHGTQSPVNLSTITGSLEINQNSSKRQCPLVLNLQKCE
jgi:hypothetical protein